MHALSARRLGIVGLIFVALLVIGIFIAPASPNNDASALKVMSYYQHHETVVQVQSYLIMAAVVVGIFFFWYFRTAVATTERDRHLATIGFGGAVLFAGAGGLAAGFLWAAVDAAKHANPSTVRAFNLLQTDATAFLGAAGIVTLLLASSAAILLGKALPQWLGWLGVVLGVASFVFAPFAGPISGGLWVLIASIVLLARTEKPTAQEPRVPVMTDV